MSAEDATYFAACKPFDIDHPLVSTKEAITIQKLTLDLLHLSVWISVDMAFDAYAYLDVEALRRRRKKFETSGTPGATFEDLAKIYHATPQAIHQALSRTSSVGRRDRALKLGRMELQRMLQDAQKNRSDSDF